MLDLLTCISGENRATCQQAASWKVLIDRHEGPCNQDAYTAEQRTYRLCVVAVGDDVVVKAPAVIYLAGSSRCGSTLVERALGEMPGFVNVGELIDLSRRVAPRGERCGCGRVFENCPFWVQVGARAFGGWNPERLVQTHLLQRDVARQRHFPQLLALGLAGRAFRDKVAQYGAVYAHVYQAVAEEAGASYVVDASKWPVQALALHRAGVDVRVINLVR